MDLKLRKQLRAIGHQLQPVVTVGGNGISESVVAEIRRALDDHELIKIKVAGSRDDRYDVEIALADFEATEIVQAIGGTLLVYRPAAKPKTGLSNLSRPHLA